MSPLFTTNEEEVVDHSTFVKAVATFLTALATSLVPSRTSSDLMTILSVAAIKPSGEPPPKIGKFSVSHFWTEG